MQDGQTFLVDGGYSLYIGTMGAGHVISVSGVLLFVCVNEDLEETYTVRDFASGDIIIEGNMHIEPVYTDYSESIIVTQEQREALAKRALEIYEEKYGEPKTKNRKA